MTAPTTPLASVLMIAYNHERYIRQAIDSVLAQQVSFPYEFVIAEDRSTDGTRAIISEYHTRHPDLVRPLFRDVNIGMHRNVIEGLRACRGRYVALLDGDDYWLTADKLEKQVRLLETRPECAVTFGRARVFYEDGRQEPWEYPMTDRTEFTIDDVLAENKVPTCTAAIRLGLLLEIPEWWRQSPFPDWGLYVLLAQYGDLVLLPETLSAYRVHSGGVFSGLTREQVQHNYQVFYRLLERELPEKYARVIREKLE